MTEPADQPTVCPMCGSDGSAESPGCGHCRPELRSGVVIGSRRDPAPPQMKKLTKVTIGSSLGHVTILALWSLAALIWEGTGPALFILAYGALLTSPAVLVLLVLNGVSFLREANGRAKRATGGLALLYAAICAVTVWVNCSLLRNPPPWGP